MVSAAPGGASREARIRALQRTIHAAAREIGMEAEDRRALQLIATGKPSTATMSEAELGAVLEALKGRGWKPAGHAGRPRSERPDIRYIHVLWRLLADAGHVTKDRRALNSFIRTRFGAKGAAILDVDMMRDGPVIAAVTEALKAMCARHGIETARPEARR